MSKLPPSDKNSLRKESGQLAIISKMLTFIQEQKRRVVVVEEEIVSKIFATSFELYHDLTVKSA